MRIRRRKYGIGIRLTLLDRDNRDRRRLGKSNDNRLKFEDIVLAIGVILFCCPNPLPETFPYREELRILLVVALSFVGAFLNLRRKSPRRCWTSATWSMGMFALVVSVVPWILHALGDIDVAYARNLSLISIPLWLAGLGCFLRLKYIRRRSQETIVRLRLNQRRHRAENLY